MSNARLREVLNGGHATKEKGPPIADGTLSVTLDAPEAHELRNRRTALDCVSTSSTYLEEDADGLKPSELYGKFTWKIERFSETSKRELRSNVFEVGQYRWYILVYPQGCDVCNHLSLFLCVADYDKLLPGQLSPQLVLEIQKWDPKKSKYSDTLHRFCKKEHDWGWKKFMELGKILDGFTTNDTLVIKAQIQVIKDCMDRPFRCLDPQYRQELVRVYLSNVESICRRFIEQSRENLAWLKTNAATFKNFWKSLTIDSKKTIIIETEDMILKGLVKRFFNEKEVASTLVMDAIFCGCKQVEESGQVWIEGNRNPSESPHVLIDRKNGIFFLAGDILQVIEAASHDSRSPLSKDNKLTKDIIDDDSPSVRLSQCDDAVKDSIVKDEHRLAELGRKTVEMFVISHIFTERIEIAYQEAECLKRQEELLREEEEAERKRASKQKLKAQTEKEKRSKRKEKKKVQREAERQDKLREDAERVRKEQERKQEAERKRREEQEEKRLLEEELEKEHQQALEEARKRAEEKEALKQEMENHQKQETQHPYHHLDQHKVVSQGEKENTLCKSKSLTSKNSKPVSNKADAEKKDHYHETGAMGGSGVATSQEKANGGGESEKRKMVESDALYHQEKMEEIIKGLKSKVENLQKNLTEKDSQLISLQNEISDLKKAQSEVEPELSNKKHILIKPTTISKSTQTSSIYIKTEPNGFAAQSNGPTHEASCTSRTGNGDHQGTAMMTDRPSKDKSSPSHLTRGSKMTIATTPSIHPQASTSGHRVKSEETNEMVGTHRPKLESSISSGDETCSDMTFVDHNGCASHALSSVDQFQVSDSNTQETRSISSLGTQMENNVHENDVSAHGHESERGQRVNEQVSASVGTLNNHLTHTIKWDPLQQQQQQQQQAPGYPIQQSVAMYPPSGAMTTGGHIVGGQMYTMPMYPPTRSTSGTSCIQRTQTPIPGMDIYGIPASRSYSLDGGMSLQQPLSGVNYPYYHEFAAMQDPSRIYCGNANVGTIQGNGESGSNGAGHFSEYSLTQDIPSQHGVHTQRSLPAGDYTSLDDFAHLAIIKDLLE